MAPFPQVQIKLVETWKWATPFFSTVSTNYHQFHQLPPFPPITTIFHHFHHFARRIARGCHTMQHEAPRGTQARVPGARSWSRWRSTSWNGCRTTALPGIDPPVSPPQFEPRQDDGLARPTPSVIGGRPP